MSSTKNVTCPPYAKSAYSRPIDGAAAKTNNTSLQIGLQVMRCELSLSQKAIADIIGVSQPAIAQIEQRGNDVKLATLKRYVEAMGGKISLTIDLPKVGPHTFNI